MPSVSVRNLPEETHRALRVRAAQNGRSTEAEIRAILEAALKPGSHVNIRSALQALGQSFGGVDLDQVRDHAPIQPAEFAGGAMAETRIAKLSSNGASQAVRLPAEFRFEGDAVYATRDQQTGDVILSSVPGARSWAGFFDLLHEAPAPADFLDDRPMNAVPVEQPRFKADD